MSAALFSEGTAARLLAATILCSLALVLYLLRHLDELMAARAGRVLLLLGALLLPVAALAWGAQSNLHRATETRFCLSCHEMEPYGKSLMLAEGSAIPAAHYENNRVPRDRACYACHADYTMFGTVKDKGRGLRHMYVHYVRGVPDKIELYHPYRNANCLRCHAGGRGFDEQSAHVDAPLADLYAGKTSCIECHDSVHMASKVEKMPAWTPGAIGQP